MFTKNSNRAASLIIGIIVLLSGCATPQAQLTSATSTPPARTGIAELDVIIGTGLKGDTPGLLSLIAFTETRCTFAEGIGGPPKCLPGEKEGTLVEVLPFLGPEGHFFRKQDIQNWKGLDAPELYAVYQVSDRAYSEDNYPAGEYAIVFVRREGNATSVTLQVRQGRIVRIDDGYTYPPRIPQEDVVRYLVSPATRPK